MGLGLSQRALRGLGSRGLAVPFLKHKGFYGAL